MKKFTDFLKEGERGLWDNIHAKRKRIKAGSGEKMRKPGSKGAPTDAALKASQNEEVEQIDELSKDTLKSYGTKAALNNFGKHLGMKNAQHDWDKSIIKKHFTKRPEFTDAEKSKMSKRADSAKKALAKGYTGHKEELTADEQFDLIEELVMGLAEQHNIDPDAIWEKFEELDDNELLEAAVDAKGHKSSTGGLTQKGRDAYNAKGANLQAPVTTPPSKLDPDSKAAKRRKSFCARMGGMEGPMKKPNGEPTRKALALRKWNC